MNLYVIRHGQTEANVKQLFNGINDGDLTEIGIKQAEELIPLIKEKDINFIICSPLKRAIHTANILNVNNKEIVLDNRLIDRDYGVYTLKPITLLENKTSLYDLEINENKEIEPFSAVIKRTEDFINGLKTKYKNENILIVTHRDVISAMQYYFNKNFDDYPKTGDLLKFEV